MDCIVLGNRTHPPQTRSLPCVASFLVALNIVQIISALCRHIYSMLLGKLGDCADQCL